jgi:hypothetical protein
MLRSLIKTMFLLRVLHDLAGDALSYFFLGQRDMGQKLRRMGQNRMFSRYGGTVGQERLNIIDTTIKCPTKVSHFWDERDTFGTKQAETEAGREWAG